VSSFGSWLAAVRGWDAAVCLMAGNCHSQGGCWERGCSLVSGLEDKQMERKGRWRNGQKLL